MYRLLAVICQTQGVYGIAVFCPLHPVYFFQGPDIILCESECADHLDIKQLLLIKIGIPRVPHIRFRGTDS